MKFNMKKYKLVNKDFEWLERITQTTISIEALYKKMYDLEINGQKDTEEFSTLMEYLTIAIDVEDKVYNDANLNYSKCVALTEYIINDKLPSEYLNDTESIMLQDYNNRVSRRILNILMHKVISDYNSVKEVLPRELIGVMEQLGMPNPEQLVSQAIYSSVELQKAFEKDILNGFLAFLQEFINKKDYYSFRKYLVRSKYNTAFINKDTEIDMRNNRFEIPETFYTNSSFIADLTQTDLELFELLKNSYGTREANQQISEIIEMNDMDYSDPTKATTSILRQCLMRAAFLLMSDEVISDINYEFHQFIEDKNYLERHHKDRISEQIVVSCFRGIKKDRNKPSVLSSEYEKIKKL